MVKEKVLFDIDKFNRLKEDINVFEELMKDVVNVFGSVMNLGIHSRISINRLIKHIGDGYINNKSGKNGFEMKSAYESDKNENMNVNMKNNDDNDMNSIRFTNNGPIFQISKSVLDTLKGSFIEEQCSEELRTNDGSIYLDYRGNDGSVYYLVNYLNGKKVDFDSLSYEEQLKILDLFEFCGLVIPLELIDCRARRDTKKKKYEEGDEIELIINGNKNDTIKEYLVKNGLWNEYVKNYDNGFIDFNHIDESFYVNKKYEYIDYITEYVNNRYIYIEEDMISHIDKELLENEIYEFFGEEGREAVKEAMIGKLNVFMNSTIIEKKCFEIPLVNWFGKGKKWKLLFRASEHNYSRKAFHKYCDNQGETVILIKHIGHNNHINIFGGYTDQSWESGLYEGKPASKEFLFTLSNEHGIPPTHYLHNGNGRGICCSSSWGLVFGSGLDIALSDECNTDNVYTYTKASSFTWIDTPQKSSLFVNTAGPDEKNYFQVEDYEVWGRA
ncbi:hypothetical protein WA158_000553 [Blastocystis sp. Blastoise]